MVSAGSVHSQTGLGLNIYIAVSDVRDGIAGAHTIVSEVQYDTTDARVMVSNVRRDVLRGLSVISIG